MPSRAAGLRAVCLCPLTCPCATKTDGQREGAGPSPGTENLVQFQSATGRLVPTFAGFDRRMNSRIASAPCRGGSPAALVPHRDNRKGPRNFQASNASSLRRTFGRGQFFFFTGAAIPHSLIDRPWDSRSGQEEPLLRAVCLFIPPVQSQRLPVSSSVERYCSVGGGSWHLGIAKGRPGLS